MTFTVTRSKPLSKLNDQWEILDHLNASSAAADQSELHLSKTLYNLPLIYIFMAASYHAWC